MGNDNIFRFILILGFAVVFPIGMYLWFLEMSSRRLVELYEAWARPDDAAKYRALLAALDQTRTLQPRPAQSE